MTFSFHTPTAIPFTKIQNFLLQALSDHRFTACQYAIMLQLVRRLQGYHKEEDVISSSQLADWTGIAAPNVRRVLGELEKLAAIRRERVPSPSGRGYGYAIRLELDVSSWQVTCRRTKALSGHERDYDFLYPDSMAAAMDDYLHHPRTNICITNTSTTWEEDDIDF